MRTLLSRFLAWLTVPWPAALREDHDWEPVVLPVDLDRIDRERGFSAAAARWGKSNLPRSQDLDLDAGHAEIYSYFTDLVGQLHSRVSKRLSQYRSTFEATDPDFILKSIEGSPSRFRGDMATQYSNHRLRIESLDHEADRAQTDLNTFRDKQQIDREPVNPGHKAVVLSIPALFLVVDIAFNSFAFSSATEGLRGGIRIALVVGLVNVVLAAFCGYWFRYVNRRELILKAIGGLALLVLIGLLPFNLLVAHYRDIAFSLSDISGLALSEAEARAKSIFELAKASFVTSPLDLKSPESWGLFLLGSFICVASAIDGYKFDDPVPGYQALYRTLRGIEEQRAQEREAFNAAMKHLWANGVDALRRAEGEFQLSQRRANDRRSLSLVAVEVYERQTDMYRAAYEAMVRRYRLENQFHRPDGLTPAAFSISPKNLAAPRLEFDVDSESRLVARYAEVGLLLPAAITSARAAIENEWKLVESAIAGSGDAP